MNEEEVRRATQAIWKDLDAMAAADPAQYKKFVESQLKQGVEEGYDKGIYIVPEPGFVLKTRDSAGKKIMINLCSHEKIDPPAAMPDAAGSADDETPMRFPMSSGDRRIAPDKTGGSECFVWDVVLNPQTVEIAKTPESTSFAFLVEIVAQCYEEKFKATIPRALSNFVILQRKKYFDTPVRSQFIIDRRAAAGKTEVLLSDVKADERQGQSLLSAVISRPSVGAAGAKATSDGAQCPKFVMDVRRDASGQPRNLAVSVVMPLLDSAEGIDLVLDCARDTLALRAGALYALTIDLPLQTRGDGVVARFKRAQHELLIDLPVVGVL